LVEELILEGPVRNDIAADPFQRGKRIGDVARLELDEHELELFFLIEQYQGTDSLVKGSKMKVFYHADDRPRRPFMFTRVPIALSRSSDNSFAADSLSTNATVVSDLYFLKIGCVEVPAGKPFHSQGRYNVESAVMAVTSIPCSLPALRG